MYVLRLATMSIPCATGQVHLLVYFIHVLPVRLKFIFTHSDHRHLVIFIITLLGVSVTGQVIEFDPSLNDTIYINVSVIYIIIRMYEISTTVTEDFV